MNYLKPNLNHKVEGMIGSELPDLLAGVQRRSPEGLREEHWHCRVQVAAAAEHLAGAAWPPAGAGWAAGDAEQVAGGGIPGQPAADAAAGGEQLSGAGLQNGRLPEQGLEVELQQEPVTVRLSIGKRCKCFKLFFRGWVE